MKKVLIPTKLNPVAADTLAARGDYDVVQDENTPLADLAAAHADAYALIVRSEKVTAGIIDALPHLKVVVRAGAGYNTIDTRHARRRGVDVMNTPGANSNAVAEEVLAMMLADARHIIPADASTRAGRWEKKTFMGREIAGKTVGIVGLGNIGQLVARRLSGFGVRLLGYDPVISRERAEDFGVTLTDLETLFAESDYISLHVPENDETRGLVGARLLAGVKTGATIINCARAGIVNEDDLRAAKAGKRLRFLNDVYPEDKAGDKSIADVADIMLPHIGASTVEANFKAARRAAEQLIDFDVKGITSFIVNREIPEGLDEAYCELANMLARLARSTVGRDTKLSAVETSFYGSLEPYGDWLLVPIVAGLWADFDRSMDHREALTYLEERGIAYRGRDTDPSKGFENSITVDLLTDDDRAQKRRVSVRGTVAESTLMVSRIDRFDKLYFEPRGHVLFFLYQDRPGVIGAIGSALAEAGINIEDMRNPHDAETDQSLAILQINQRASAEVIEHIKDRIDPLAAFDVEF